MKKELCIKKFVVLLLCALLCVSTVSVTNADAAVRKVRKVKTTRKKPHRHKLTSRVRWNRSHTRYARWCKGCNRWITCQG